MIIGNILMSVLMGVSVKLSDYKTDQKYDIQTSNYFDKIF